MNEPGPQLCHMKGCNEEGAWWLRASDEKTAEPVMALFCFGCYYEFLMTGNVFEASMMPAMVRHWSWTVTVATLWLAQLMGVSKKRARKEKKYAEIRLQQWLKGRV